MTRAPVLLVCLALCVNPAAFADPQEAAEAKALEAAEAWLATVDRGDLGESWENAATYFKNSVTKAEWERVAAAGRNPLGEVKSRKLMKLQAATSLPGAPDGHYVVISFETSFEHKKEAVETVTPMLDEDGEWRVAGYFVR